MQVTLATEKNSAEWDAYVSRQPACVNYHRWGWRRVIEEAFRWQSFYLMAEEDGRSAGILPLVWLKSRVFGSLLCSVPFFSGAGLVADTPAACEALLAEALGIARESKAKYVELRHRGLTNVAWPSKTSKVTLECDIFPTAEENMQHLPTKMRTNVRRSLKSGLEASFGGQELLPDFYDVFSLKMRELGTPVYSRAFFEAIFRHFREEALVCLVRHRQRVVAGGLLTGYRGSIEANWSAASPKAMNLRPNMFLFWQMLCAAGERGYRVFDFGRSSVGSGTYQFKQQWNSRVVPLYWNYWSRAGEEAMELNPDNPKYRAAIWTWQRLPVFLTRWIGPSIARCLP